ncbi:MAG: CoA transferase, partial [Steroidobacteraceae bacterium]|nr:CoA transferase [Steroidobacteraceae bacterium]
EAVLAMMESLITEYVKTGYIRERTGAILPNVAPSNVYQTADNMVLIAANQDTVFARLCEAMGKPEWIKDPRFVSHQARGANQALLDSMINEWTKQHTTAHVLELMDRYGVPAGQIYRAPEMLNDPHFKARAAIVTTQHPIFGELPMQNVVPKLSATPGSIRSAAPVELGQHNDEIYRGLLGYDEARIAALRAAKVI